MKIIFHTSDVRTQPSSCNTSWLCGFHTNLYDDWKCCKHVSYL